MKRKLWQELNDQQAEKLCGGVNKGELVDKVAEKAQITKQPEAEGKIRGTLILTLA